MSRLLGILGVLFMLCACKQPLAENPQLQEANQIYQKSLLMQDAFLVGYDSMSQTVFSQTPSDSMAISIHQTFRSLEKRYRLWENSLVDVPGFEAESAPRSLLYGIPPQDILAIHQDQKKVMESLIHDLEQLKTQLLSLEGS